MPVPLGKARVAVQ